MINKFKMKLMNYYKQIIPKDHLVHYEKKQRILNVSWSLKYSTWKFLMSRYNFNPLVHSCGVEGLTTESKLCKNCGNCLREYFNTMERMKNGKEGKTD